MICCNFSNFCRKKFPGLTKEIFCTYWMNLEVCHTIFANHNPQSCTKMLETFLSSQETFFCRNLKNYSVSFWAHVMLRELRIWASRASPAQKSRGLRVVLFQKLFQGYILCFLGDSFGWCIFEQYARETDLKKKRSVCLTWPKVPQILLLVFLW